VVAIPVAGTDFAGWAGCDSTSTTAITNDTCHVSLTEDTIVTATFDDMTAPVVTSATPTGTLSVGPSQLTITFSEDVRDPGGSTVVDDVTNPENYLMLQRGVNGIYNTTSCAGGVAGDDLAFPVGPVSYDAGTFSATVTVNGGTPLPAGDYRVFVCGTTSIVDIAGNALMDGSDYVYGFSVVDVLHDVTGGGWIDSPAGAYTADPTLEGKANFSFVSKYRRGASVPIGQTNFRLRVADLLFHSDSCEWLVVAGSRTQFKGVGTINGEGEYRFVLTAIDADLQINDSHDSDRFRIRIWWEDDLGGEHVVYDNQPGDNLASDVTTELGGGSIVIHR
jgi:hypothetical protein